MTINTSKVLFISMLMFFAGCNGDIFVDDYMPEGQNEITISETDNSKEINFKSDNWGLISIICDNYGPYTTNVYSIDGELTSLPFEEKELGTVHYTSDYMDVRVEKKSGDKLKVILNENLMNENAEMYIMVSNEFKSEIIKLLLAPTQKYQIDSVIYDWDKFETHEGGLREIQSLIVDNQNSAAPLTIGFFPFINSTREIDFYDPAAPHFDDVYSNLLGIPLPRIVIPDIVDGKPALLDTKVELGVDTQHLTTNLDKGLVVDVTIDAFDIRKVIVFNEFKSYSVPYKIYLSNPKTGKKLTFSGELHSREPIDYYIFKRALDENENE